jgi:hypothetical protein
MSTAPQPIKQFFYGLCLNAFFVIFVGRLKMPLNGFRVEINRKVQTNGP